MNTCSDLENYGAALESRVPPGQTVCPNNRRRNLDGGGRGQTQAADADVHRCRAAAAVVGEEQRLARVGAPRHVVSVWRHLHKRCDSPAEDHAVSAADRVHGDLVWGQRTCSVEQRMTVTMSGNNFLFNNCIFVALRGFLVHWLSAPLNRGKFDTTLPFLIGSAVKVRNCSSASLTLTDEHVPLVAVAGEQPPLVLQRGLETGTAARGALPEPAVVAQLLPAHPPPVAHAAVQAQAHPEHGSAAGRGVEESPVLLIRAQHRQVHVVSLAEVPGFGPRHGPGEQGEFGDDVARC